MSYKNWCRMCNISRWKCNHGTVYDNTSRFIFLRPKGYGLPFIVRKDHRYNGELTAADTRYVNSIVESEMGSDWYAILQYDTRFRHSYYRVKPRCPIDEILADRTRWRRSYPIAEEYTYLYGSWRFLGVTGYSLPKILYNTHIEAWSLEREIREQLDAVILDQLGAGYTHEPVDIGYQHMYVSVVNAT